MAPPLTGQQLMRRQVKKVQRQVDDLAANVPGFLKKQAAQVTTISVDEGAIVSPILWTAVRPFGEWASSEASDARRDI
jgi:hypothetical protein